MDLTAKAANIDLCLSMASAGAKPPKGINVEGRGRGKRVVHSEGEGKREGQRKSEKETERLKASYLSLSTSQEQTLRQLHF